LNQDKRKYPIREDVFSIITFIKKDHSNENIENKEESI